MRQDHFKYVKILLWHIWLTLNGQGRNITWDLWYMTGQGAKNRKEEYLKKRKATEDKFYVFILSRDSLDRIIFLNIFFTSSWKTPEYCSSWSKLDIGILNQPWDLNTCSQRLKNPGKYRGKKVFIPTNHSVLKPSIRPRTFPLLDTDTILTDPLWIIWL